MSISSQGLNFMGTGELVALFSHKRRLSQDAFSERDRFSEILTPRMLRNFFLMEIEITCLPKQDPNPLNNCIGELQQQAYAQRLELEDTHHGYVESRRERVRLQEGSVVKGKAVRNTQIRSMDEMGEMKRAQELRVDDSGEFQEVEVE